VKRFCNVKSAIAYIQDIDIINAFRSGVSDIKTVEEIVMKKPKTVADLLVVTDVCIEPPKPGLDFWNLGARGPQGRRMITRSNS
jgi:hypothetical protein